MEINLVSTPAEGAITRDLTNATIICDGENSMDEKFHFEIDPAKPETKKMPDRKTDGISKKDNARVLNVVLGFIKITT